MTARQWPLEMLDWKRRVFAIYADARGAGAGPAAVQAFRAAKDALFAGHRQSPVPRHDRAHFAGLPYFTYRPDLRVSAPLEPIAIGPATELPSSGGDEPMRFRAVGTVSPLVAGSPIMLTAYWLTTYGGGLFIPFRDVTSGDTTYGAGRYLLDTVKGADLGLTADGELVLDFNYAYNPSCAYDPRWACPLAPEENRLTIPIEAGERIPSRSAPGAA